MASISLPLFLLALIMSTHLLRTAAADCAYPCLPPPQVPNNPSQPAPYNYLSPPPPVTNPYTPPYWNYPPLSGNYNPPANGFVYASPPPPNPIVPWYPWYYHPPPSGSAGLMAPLLTILVLLGCMMAMLNF